VPWEKVWCQRRKTRGKKTKRGITGDWEPRWGGEGGIGVRAHPGKKKPSEMKKAKESRGNSRGGLAKKKGVKNNPCTPMAA